MADIKPQVYKDPRPAEYFTRFHERSRTEEPDWVYDVARIDPDSSDAALLPGSSDRRRERPRRRGR